MSRGGLQTSQLSLVFLGAGGEEKVLMSRYMHVAWIRDTGFHMA